ncbi:hypothetical protein T440DRAFT_469911 [Plenodomus tracheiphilus IPT5]|uniref:Uncharacterized protein n=1 Tax=Plenodomus tracheiphilus IPT5 TaxID=1408161 RepID=A0A6A7AZY2_9PLEO|nr:hypothetical protein T440DRAFT_469911 [Plenodomus tracheiphilus IPT5]
MSEQKGGMLERRNSKRQRLVRFLRSWRQKPQDHDDVHMSTVTEPAPAPPQAVQAETRPTSPIDSKPPDVSTESAKIAPIQENETESKPPSIQTPKDNENIAPLSDEQLRVLFAGAPHFQIRTDKDRFEPLVSFPWDNESTKENASDSVLLTEPAFAATSLHTAVEVAHSPVGNEKTYKGYIPDVVEMPNMLGSQGVEPGSTGFSYFVGLPISDSLVIELEELQPGIEYLETTRNKELMQTSPERLGIRPVELGLIYDRLIEFQDLYEAFQDSPEPMTILNNQSSGDLYANLFCKFLTPPGYDDSTDDPTGLQVQILVLLRILKLKGVWYDFSLVEWRIRLGQILWSDPEPYSEHEPHPLWTKREILLLQITLSCELLLRLDAFTNIDALDAELRLRINPEDIKGFHQAKTKKVDWDMVLACTFLENISIMKGNDVDGLMPQPKSRGLLSLLGGNDSAESPLADVILLPQHQTRQLSGLLHFAETMRWPGAVDVLKELASKLGVPNVTNEAVQQLSSSNRSLDYNTPSCISVYGTPLQTPLPTQHVLDSYFGNVGQPSLNRHDSQSLRVPLSPSWSAPNDRPALDGVGGWLSRSYLTGLVLPGEAISHFLISTLLENDKSAISSLGDSANLYGGFTYEERTWWSKNSIVGRVLACSGGSTECMGWISCPKLPSGLTGWHNVHSEQLPHDHRFRMEDGSDPVSQDSTIIPQSHMVAATSEDLVLPSDPELPPKPILSFLQWELTPINPDLIDDDNLAVLSTDDDIQAASISFASHDQTLSYTVSLAYDVHFITSWPCTTPASAAPPVTGLPYILKRSRTGTLSRSSSKRSVTLSRRSSHGFEPLLSHPPTSSTIAPKRTYDIKAEEEEIFSPHNLISHGKPLHVHPMHKSYLYKIVPAARVLEPEFEIPFEMHTSKSTERLFSPTEYQDSVADTIVNNKKTVLILDARASSDMELLARAWCAEKGFHAVVGRTTRTCLACCIREARGLNIKIVIRV